MNHSNGNRNRGQDSNPVERAYALAKRAERTDLEQVGSGGPRSPLFDRARLMGGPVYSDYALPHRAGQPHHAVHLRDISPENLLGDGCTDADVAICDKGRPLPAVMPAISGLAAKITSSDFNQIGTVGQMRASIERMYASCPHSPTVIAAINGANSSSATFPDPNVPSVGFVVDYGISMLAYAPFILDISTTGAESLESRLLGLGVQVDRALSLRVERQNGFSIFYPWAQRVSPSMQIAQSTIACNSDLTPIIVTANNIPAALIASFSMQVTLLSAFNPRTAEFAGLLGLYGNVRSYDEAGV